MNILLATDAFPPTCGGSGWRTFELARSLRGRGHAVLIVQPKPGSDTRVREAAYDGFRVLEFGAAAPTIPYVRNYFKNERLYDKLSAFLAQVITAERIDSGTRTARVDLPANRGCGPSNGRAIGVHGA